MVDAASVEAIAAILALISLQEIAAQRIVDAVTTARFPATVRADAAARLGKLHLAAITVAASAITRNATSLPAISPTHRSTFRPRLQASSSTPYRTHRISVARLSG